MDKSIGIKQKIIDRATKNLADLGSTIYIEKNPLTGREGEADNLYVRFKTPYDGESFYSAFIAPDSESSEGPIVDMVDRWCADYRVNFAKAILAKKNEAKQIQSYWLSWYDELDEQLEYHGPWWISGFQESNEVERAIICAAVQAESQDAAKEAVFAMHDERPEWIEFRFCEEARKDWNPLIDMGQRFPAEFWMVWPIDSNLNKEIIARNLARI